MADGVGLKSLLVFVIHAISKEQPINVLNIGNM